MHIGMLATIGTKGHYAQCNFSHLLGLEQTNYGLPRPIAWPHLWNGWPPIPRKYCHYTDSKEYEKIANEIFEANFKNWKK